MESKRVKRMWVTREYLLWHLKQKTVHFKIDNPLPEDAKVVGVDYNAYRDSILFVIESNEFPKVAEGAELEEIDPIEIRTINFPLEKQLAEFIHEEYEKLAKENNWKTQESCQVKFDDLPTMNKITMMQLSEKILKKFKGDED